jgi:hypothetical protein
VTSLRDVVGQHREHLLSFLAQLGLSIFGLATAFRLGLLLVIVPDTRADLVAAPVIALAYVAGALAVLTWIAFSLRWVIATRIGAVLVALAAVADAGLYIASPRPAHSAAPIVAVLLLIPALSFLAVVFVAAGMSRPAKRDDTRPPMGWPVALPLYALGYALAVTGLVTAASGTQPLKNLPSGILWGSAVLGFSVVGALRWRRTLAFEALGCVIAVVLYLPAIVSWLLITAAAGQPTTVGWITGALLVVLIPALLWLAHHRANTAPSVPLNPTSEGG